MTPETTPANYRAVLIGIDDYAQKPLGGCVNDIDRIERVLLDRLRIPPERITRLTAPRSGAAVSTRLPTLPPTREEIRGRLTRLAEEIGKGDAVFVYYSGHGSQVMTDWSGNRVAREGLVPVDYWTAGEERRLLYDFELNSLFTRIAERAGDLTVVLDCCHSAGATRAFEDEAADRYLEIPEVQRLEPRDAGDASQRDAARLVAAEGVHMLTAACRSNETAREVDVPDGASGAKRRHGAFTHALLQILNAADRPLPELRWADVWPSLLDSVGRVSPQNPLLVGRWERRLFGGPWTPRDTGYLVQRDGERLRIRGGTLTGLTDGALVALYGSNPDLFPPLDSPEDHAARLGLVRVEIAERASCIAVPVNGLGELPAATRGRLVKPGEPDLLVASLEPFDQELAERFAFWDIRTVAADNTEAEARVRLADGCFLLGDDVYDDPTNPERPPLAEVPAGRVDLLEAALRHYARYNLVLRFPRRCQDLPEALQINLLDCGNLTPEKMQPHQLQDPDLPKLALGKASLYEIQQGEGFAIRIGNRASCPLHVSVFNCAGSGRVEHLGEAEIPADGRHVFWNGGILGNPFYPAVGIPGPAAVDRLVIVGTTRPDQDLQHLEVPESFAEVLGRFRDLQDRDTLAPKTAPPAPPVEQWTAEMVPLRIYV